MSPLDRDPEAEAEDKTEEEKLPGADDDGPAAIESGTQNAGGGDWEAPAAGFSGATATGWDGAANEEWAGGPAGEWANEPAKETQW